MSRSPPRPPFFFFNDTATTEIYTLSLHDALPIFFTGWAQATAAQQIQDIFSAGTKIDGVWTSGIDNTIVDAFKTANKTFVPIVGADNNQFVGYLNTEKTNGLTGVAAHHPPPDGGARGGPGPPAPARQQAGREGDKAHPYVRDETE